MEDVNGIVKLDLDAKGKGNALLGITEDTSCKGACEVPDCDVEEQASVDGAVFNSCLHLSCWLNGR